MKPARSYILQQLAKKTALVEVGALADARDDAGFLRRLNGLVVASRWTARVRMPVDLADAVKDARCELHPDAELLAFGQWLMIDGAPGLEKQGGRTADMRIIARTLATAMAVLHRREHVLQLDGGRTPVPVGARITKSDLAVRWGRMFDDAAKSSDFDSRMRTLRRLLPVYLDHLEAGSFQIGGTLATKSPLIKRVLKGLEVRKPSSTAAKLAPAKAVSKVSPVVVSRTPVEAGDLAPFDCLLRYSSPETEEEHRQRLPGGLPLAMLTYRTEWYRPSASGMSAQVGRSNHLVLAADLDIARHIRITALIDRMAVLLHTQKPTTGPNISKLLARKCGAIAYAQDRRVPVGNKREDWRSKLPVIENTVPTGVSFAVMIQEPTASRLTAALEAIDQEWTITGPVQPFLCELGLDFFPDKDPNTTADERLILRERTVGALQRHHWCRSEKLDSTSVRVPRAMDARQTYKAGGKAGASTRYHFPSKSENHGLSDTNIKEPGVRRRILSAGGSEALMLNATVYRGAEAGDVLIRIQHKIGDRRNKTTGTSLVLPEAVRRARIEVEISGQERLAELGLTEVGDLARLQFRDLRKELLVFRLPLVEAIKEDLVAAKAQMTCRGIYGWEHWCLARAAQEKENARKKRIPGAGRVRTRGEHLAAWTELNRTIGHALDLLGSRWKKFTWNANRSL